MFTVGPSASNGKSTCSKMFDCTFPIYTRKIDRRTFNSDYSKQHKQFSELRAPVRYAYIEEADKKLDAGTLKDFVDGTKIGGNEILYGTCEDIYIQCKLNFILNCIPNFITDEGIRRRGQMQELTNKFILERDYNKLSNKTGVFVARTNLMVMFNKPEYKNAFAHLIIQYSTQYYTQGLVVSESLSLDFSELCKENDIMSSFLDKYYTRTYKDTDRVHKDDILKSYQAFTKNTSITWINVLSDIKRITPVLVYNRQARESGGKKQGCILGLIKNNDDDDDDVIGMVDTNEIIDNNNETIPIHNYEKLDMEVITALHDEAMDNFKVVLNLEPPERGIIHDAEKDADNIMSIMGLLDD